MRSAALVLSLLVAAVCASRAVVSVAPDGARPSAGPSESHTGEPRPLKPPLAVPPPEPGSRGDRTVIVVSSAARRPPVGVAASPSPAEAVLGAAARQPTAGADRPADPRPTPIPGSADWPSQEQAEQLAQALGNGLTGADVRCLAGTALADMGWDRAFGVLLSASEDELAALARRLARVCRLDPNRLLAVAGPVRSLRDRP